MLDIEEYWCYDAVMLNKSKDRDNVITFKNFQKCHVCTTMTNYFKSDYTSMGSLSYHHSVTLK